jgi:hypothetical protein
MIIASSTDYPPGAEATRTANRPFFRLVARTKTEPAADITLTFLVGVVLIATGLRAYLPAFSFFQVVAPYPPYHEHLFHDIGAFLAGLNMALVRAVRIQDGLTIPLVRKCSGGDATRAQSYPGPKSRWLRNRSVASLHVYACCARSVSQARNACEPSG